MIAAFKMSYKRKLVAWTLQQFDRGSVQDLGKLNVNLFEALLWSVAAWHELDDQTIRNCWRKSAILPVDWNADIQNLDERVKMKVDEAVLELGTLIGALNLGSDIHGHPLEKLSPMEYVNMEGEDEFEVELSAEELLQFVQQDEEVLSDAMEEDIGDGIDDLEPRVVKLDDAQMSAKDVLSFMASQGSKMFGTEELLAMERIHDKLIKVGVAHLTSTPTKQCDIKGFLVSSERSLFEFNETL